MMEQLAQLLRHPALQYATTADVNKVHLMLSYLMFACGIASFIALMTGMTAPYGRYSSSKGWGMLLNARLAWLTQELPSLLVPLLLIAKAVADKRFLLKAGLLVHYSGLGRALLFFIKQARVALGLAFLLHYTYRALAFPLLIRGGKPTPLVVWAMALAFCLWNGFLQGWFLSQQMKATLPVTHPRVAAGLAIWLFGFLNVLRADAILRSLRKHGESGYKVPHGGMFEYVSAGNYGAEIIEWAGYALAAGSLAPAAFAFFTFCNLAPRGHAHHQWYKRKFEEYPKSRRAVIPFLW